MRSKLIFVAAAGGLIIGLLAAWFFSLRHPPQPPAFTPAANPYAKGIYADGVIESYQDSGANINVFPEVSGPVVKTFAAEGKPVKRGTPLLMIDSSVQEKTVAQQKAAAEAARTLLAELKAQPRPETLNVVVAQRDAAAATVKQLTDSLTKLQRSVELDPRSVSREALDTATNAVKVGEANLEVARRQYELTKAGAWHYDVANQEHLAESLQRQYEASAALLEKYTLRAPVDGTVLAVNAALGGYLSPQGSYDTYTQGFAPPVVMSGGQQFLSVRVYVDEILVHRLPAPGQLAAEMQLRGTDTKIPLEFVRVQPYVTPKIELSDERQERVDLRVLPVIFRFQKAAGMNVYPGQLVDVYIGTKGH